MKKIDREEFAKKVEEERTLREYVRKAIVIAKQRKETEKNTQILEENKLRNLIKTLILEGIPPDSSEPGPIHKNKGMNELEKLLFSTQVLTDLKSGYQSLTTTKESRDSFRAHIIKAVERLLDGVDRLRRVDEGANIEIDVGDTEEEPLPRLTDPNISKEQEQEDDFSIPGMDFTGRDEAMETFDKVESQIKKAYSKLHDPKDQKPFREMLITELKMQFDEWESTLPREDGTQVNPEEPTTDEYEEKKSMDRGGL